MRLDDTADDVPDVVGASAKDDSLGADLSGSNFSDDGVDDWADGHGVCAEPDEAQNGLNVFDGCSLVYAGEDGDEIERYYEDVEASKEDRAASKARDEEPGEDCATESNTGTTETDTVGRVSVNTSLLKEANRS